ncbi:MAG: hypothetical protein IJZ04_10545 [Clostridia bacterium]|nr:hypothetical protein [Clostridia bacterium]MBQ8739916.1 hypothetical protein [Clostridia bacterium]
MNKFALNDVGVYDPRYSGEVRLAGGSHARDRRESQCGMVLAQMRNSECGMVLSQMRSADK